MIDKALTIIIAMYAIGFSMLGVQYTVASSFGVTMISPVTGEPIESALVGYIQEGEFNTRTQNIVGADFQGNSTYYNKVETFTTSAAFVAWELIELMTGTYIFHILLLFGVPQIWVTLFIALYVLLLARAIIGYVRGI
uniref:ORF41 n=1 Tax=Nitrosopumilaceae spindle-shaped virus TaxID=3065433 RepID=A0AAT9J7B8_9VIRU